jgi:hypothetical protein
LKHNISDVCYRKANRHEKLALAVAQLSNVWWSKAGQGGGRAHTLSERSNTCNQFRKRIPHGAKSNHDDNIKMGEREKNLSSKTRSTS